MTNNSELRSRKKEFRDENTPMNVGAIQFGPRVVGCSCDKFRNIELIGHAADCPFHLPGPTTDGTEREIYCPPPDVSREPAITFEAVRDAFRMIDVLEQENKELREKVQQYEDDGVPRSPMYAKHQRLMAKCALLREFAEHVVRTDQVALKGTPLGVRAKETLEEVDEI